MLKGILGKNNKCNSKRTSRENRRGIPKCTSMIALVLAGVMSVSVFTGCDISAAGIKDVIGRENSKEDDSSDRKPSVFDRAVQEVEGHGSDNVDAGNTDNHSDGNGIKVYSTEGNLVEPEITVVEYTEAANPSADENENTVAEELEVAEATDSNIHNNRYVYSKLSADEKTTYREIYNVLANLKEDVVLSSRNAEEIDHVFKCVLVDYPELFYVKGYSVGKYMVGDIISKISFTGTYTMEAEDVLAKQKKIENYITNVIEQVPEGDDYSKILFIYNYLIKTLDYDLSVEDNQNILSVVESGRTVCQGYAKMTQLLLNRMGIFCTLVNGDCESVTEGGRFQTGDGRMAHVWNIVESDGQYYILDVTWGDAAFSLIDTSTGDNPVIETNYEYFLVNDDAIVATHNPKPVVDMPKCQSLDDNYYVREGLYFTEINDNKVKAAFDKAYANGKSEVFLKASDSYVYDELFQYLIDDSNIFNIIDTNNIKYVPYPERNLLLFAI